MMVEGRTDRSCSRTARPKTPRARMSESTEAAMEDPVCLRSLLQRISSTICEAAYRIAVVWGSSQRLPSKCQHLTAHTSLNVRKCVLWVFLLAFDKAKILQKAATRKIVEGRMDRMSCSNLRLKSNRDVHPKALRWIQEQSWPGLVISNSQDSRSDQAEVPGEGVSTIY